MFFFRFFRSTEAFAATGSPHNPVETEQTLYHKSNSAEEYRNYILKVIGFMHSEYSSLGYFRFFFVPNIFVMVTSFDHIRLSRSTSLHRD